MYMREQQKTKENVVIRVQNHCLGQGLFGSTSQSLASRLLVGSVISASVPLVFQRHAGAIRLRIAMAWSTWQVMRQSGSMQAGQGRMDNKFQKS